MTKQTPPKSPKPNGLIKDADITKSVFWKEIPEDRKELVLANNIKGQQQRRFQEAYDTLIDLHFMSINKPYEDENYRKEARNTVLKSSMFAWEYGLMVSNEVTCFMLDGFCKYYANRHKKGYTLEKAFGLDGKLSASPIDDFSTNLAAVEFSKGYCDGYKNGKLDAENDKKHKYLNVDKASIVFIKSTKVNEDETLKSRRFDFESIYRYGKQMGYEIAYSVNCKSNRKQKVKDKPNLEVLNVFIKKLRPGQSSRKVIKDLGLERFSE